MCWGFWLVDDARQRMRVGGGADSMAAEGGGMERVASRVVFHKAIDILVVQGPPPLPEGVS